jgi:hypothetical protein
MPPAWTREEVEATVSDYFGMLFREMRGEPFSKKEHNRALQKLLNKRNAAAIEYKHQNISAILIELGFPYIEGYKPARNWQGLLQTVVEEQLIHAGALAHEAAALVTRPEIIIPSISDLLTIPVEPPVSETVPQLNDRRRGRTAPTIRNYLEEEARNRSLGDAGEQFILSFEHERLWREGKRDLANRIEHVAQTQGEQAGYDILSFESSGRERLIEVKTTRFGPLTPFYASKNEVNVSETQDAAYHLCRLFRFSKNPKLFMLKGALGRTCILDPVLFSGLPASQ